MDRQTQDPCRGDTRPIPNNPSSISMPDSGINPPQTALIVYCLPPPPPWPCTGCSMIPKASRPHVASAGSSSLGCPPVAAEEPDPELLTWCVGCTHTGRCFGANFPTWAPELKSNTRLTLGRRLVVLALPGGSFVAENRAGLRTVLSWHLTDSIMPSHQVSGGQH